MMRTPCLCLCLLFLLLAAGLTTAGSADAAQRGAANNKSAETLYAEVVKDWRALLRNDARADKRDPWLDLERRFMAIAEKNPSNTVGAKGTFQAGRCREELAERSRLTADWQGAANHYLALAKNFPKSNLADDGLYQAASIMARHLGKQEAARTTAQSILDRYPKGDMAPKARSLLASLSQKNAPARAAKPAPQEKAKPAPSSPAAAARSTPAAPQPARLTRVVCRGTAKRATVILELDGTASFRHQYLAPDATNRNPRLLIEIENATVSPEAGRGITPSGLVVPRVRVYPLKGKKSVRVIIDLGHAQHYAVATGASPPGIHVQCSTVADLDKGTAPSAGKDGPVVGGQLSGKGPARAGTLMEQLGLTVNTIMIDAGHGGKDPGAMGNGIRESHVTLALAKMLGERLRKQGFTVLYTRTAENAIALEQRPLMANGKKADVFISLHVNSSKDATLHGLETYFLDLARTSSAATVAARENAVSVKRVSDLQFILTDIMLTSKLQESQDLAASVHQNMHSRLQTAGFSVRDNGVRSAPFYVLMGARMPAVLVEVGYLSHDDDARRIKSQKYLERLADGVAEGLIEYKRKLARFTGR